MRQKGLALIFCFWFMIVTVACTAVNSEAPQATVESSENNVNPQPNVEQKQTAYYVDSGLFKIHAVNDSEKVGEAEKIALLTFDDGPKGIVTTEILDILDKYEAKSLWFVSGFNYGVSIDQPDPAKADRFRTLVKEIHQRGHLIGNHTWSHANLRQLSAEEQKREIASMNQLLEEITGEPVRFFRPPFGADTDVQKLYMKEAGMQTMNWSVGSLDWELKEAEQVVEQVVSTIHPGANILMHDLPIQVEALDTILAQLREMGYRFMLPTELEPSLAES
ncbi:hypothetical protein BEP19_01675 [Ammoniphilus oxalaticus]|uniref:NodB homology domain-containing protein n=1 Tax=Ammoniphilus oxalaticus TaxID=66863 RepID=A0A419SN28_9BACL|nr:polysaccharide deacetylase family protein [Ammoniphilus oxalaticus]RKD25677.1 hypothetical protein BEP19_01675 [Ammoniphilus oxalaticus]